MAPEVNPVNHKARTIPVLNPLNMYGRVFFFSWWAFFVGTWSWFAFPPLTTITIKHDLNLTDDDIATGNICALISTCIVRVTAGFACDRFGPRKTYIAILLAGAIPTALAGTATNATGLIILRCFTGVLGGSFVPCEVWATAFFDKNIVGAANAMAAGWGNAGGGITYFAMPAIFDSLVARQGLSPHTAWRVTFLIPFVLILATAVAMIFFCPDTPTGSWTARHRALNQQLSRRDMFVSTAKHKVKDNRIGSGSDDKIELKTSNSSSEDVEDPVLAEQDLLAAASWELVQNPTIAQTAKSVLSLHTFALITPYFCSFGTELALIAFLGMYYFHMFPELGQTGSGNWASMYGLLNFVFRPIGGFISDAIYRPSGSLWGRKIWMHSLGFLTGIFLCVIGFVNPQEKATLFGLVVALAFTSEAGNGAGFALVPHVHPASNGVISGLTGGAGTLGGVVFTVIERHYGIDFWMTLRFMGIWVIVANLITSWIAPIPKNQLGGR
jgi:NNP family nitrate/nitrite transporter-like MFS transporter